MKRTSSRSIQWAMGTAAAMVSVGSTQAAVVKIDLNHNFTTTLDGVDFGSGLGTDAGQWVSGSFSSVRVMVAGGLLQPLAFFAGGGTYQAGTNSLGVQGTGVGATGLVAWDLADGTEGWLHLEAGGGGYPVVADYFAFSEQHIGVAGGRAAAPHGNDSRAFASAPTYSPVPELSSLALLGLGAAGVMMRRKRRAA